MNRIFDIVASLCIVVIIILTTSCARYVINTDQADGALNDNGSHDASAKDLLANEIAISDIIINDQQLTSDTRLDSPSDSIPIDTISAFCKENEHVVANQCLPCAAGTVNSAGDDPSGADTFCDDDACTRALGVTCSTFEQAYIKASNPDTNDKFGHAIALSGDTLAVGAFFESSNALGIDGNQNDNSAAESGAVYIFVRNGSSWIQQAYIKASNTDADDRFGSAIALDGDTLAIAAEGEASNTTGINGNQGDNSEWYSGAVYIFIRNGSTWTQQAYIKGSDSDLNDTFGRSISLEGDTLAVGAPFEDSNARGINANPLDNSAVSSGAAYIFTRSGTIWSQQAYIKSSNSEAGDLFGSVVSLSANTLAVGAPEEDSNVSGIDGNQSDNSATSAGAVYVFTRSGTTWSQQAYIKASNCDADDHFGTSLDLDGDTLAIGAIDESSSAAGINGLQSDNNANSSGAVYVFIRNGTIWSQQAYIKASNTEAVDWFATDIALDGDILAISARGEDSNATGVNGNQLSSAANFSGAIYLYQRSGFTWNHQAYIKASNTEPFDSVKALAISGNTLVFGAELEDSNASGMNGDQTDNSLDGSGAAYIRIISP